MLVVNLIEFNVDRIKHFIQANINQFMQCGYVVEDSKVFI